MRAAAWVAVVWVVSGCGGGQRSDAGAEPADAAVDGGLDAGEVDAGEVDAGEVDAGPTCAWGTYAPGPRPFPWVDQPGDAGIPDGGSGCVVGQNRDLLCTGRARVERSDAGEPVLVFDDGAQVAWLDANAGDLRAPRISGAAVDVSFWRYVRRANPFGPFVESTTLRVSEADAGQVLWFSRSGYAVYQAVTDAEAMELFGLVPVYRPLCSAQYPVNACWTLTRTFAEIELATVPVTILQPNELRVVGGYQVQWVHSGDAETACVRDDSAQPTPDCAFTASFQGP